jgi:hypothetical protein
MKDAEVTVTYETERHHSPQKNCLTAGRQRAQFVDKVLCSAAVRRSCSGRDDRAGSQRYTALGDALFAALRAFLVLRLA